MSDAAQSSRQGSRFGPYALKHLLGSGATGEVYEAQDTVNNRVVALKLLSPSLSNDPAFRERMHSEALVAERLSEPHVVPIHDHGEIDGQLFVDMRLIEGVSLANLLQQHRELPPPRAVTIVRQVAAALDAAHAAGLVHRDVKPENILVGNDDFAYLSDFGVAGAAAPDGATSLARPVDLWKYTAPEWFADTELSYRVDIYSLACVLYECLTGWPPYRSDDAEKLIAAHMHTQIPRPSQLRLTVPRGFDDVIARGMAKDPAQRYLRAGDLALAAYHALSRPDQDLVRQISGASHESRLPSGAVPPPAPSRPPSTPAVDYRGADVVPARPLPAPPHPIYPAGPTGEFAAPPVFAIPSRVGQGERTQRLVLGIVVIVAALALGAVALRFLLQSPHPTPASPVAPGTSTAPSTATPTISAAEAQARLSGLLPPGYPPGTCKSIVPPKGANAALSCAQNADQDGPLSAIYTLYPDAATVRSAFDKIVQTSAVIVCPGRIQSPGAWHHIANPDTPSGMVLCAATQGNPTMAWSNDTQLLVSVVQSDPQGPTIDQLFAWWSSHS
jgi:serine/threonine kinase PknH